MIIIGNDIYPQFFTSTGKIASYNLLLHSLHTLNKMGSLYKPYQTGLSVDIVSENHLRLVITFEYNDI